MLKLDTQAGHLAVVVFKKEDKELKKANARLAERRDAFRKGELDQDMSALSMKPQPFTWVSSFQSISIQYIKLTDV